MLKGWKPKRSELVRCALVGLILLAYMGIFTYLNMAKYAEHVDSDIAAEALLAREIWNEKTLTPDNWISSTERRVLGMPAVAALFYGMTESMQTAVGISCVLIGALFLGVLYWFLRKLGLSVTTSMVGMLVLCALPVNGLRNEGQMVPFVSLLLFLFAEYYVFHCILLLLGIIFYLHLKQKANNMQKISGRDIFFWAALFVLTFLLALGGQRCLQMVVLPLVIYEAVSAFSETDGFRRRLKGKRLLATGFAGSSLAAFFLSIFYDRQAGYALYLQTPRGIFERLFQEVPAALLEGFGIAGNAKVGTMASLMQLLVWAFVILVVYGAIYILRKKNGVVSTQREALLLLLVSLGTTAFIICITTAESAHNYLMVSWFAALVVTAVLMEKFQKDKSWFGDLILAAVCGFALLNINFTWKDAVTTTDNLQDYKEVADFLEEQQIAYGYAEFWDAGRISLITDGAVTMGHSYLMEDLKMYWWLTSTEWYAPNLPEEMKTAYVVKNQKLQDFEVQFEDRTEVTSVFENESFTIYISDHNFVHIR